MDDLFARSDAFFDILRLRICMNLQKLARDIDKGIKNYCDEAIVPDLERDRERLRRAGA